MQKRGGKARDLAFRLGGVIESTRFFRIEGSQFSRRVGPKAGQQRSGCSLPFEVNVRDKASFEDQLITKGISMRSFQFNRQSRSRRQRFAEAAMESLEARRLPAFDLTVASVSILTATMLPGGMVELGVTADLVNNGTDPIDLTNGTPGDTSDDVRISFYGSTDGTLDPLDQLLQSNPISQGSPSAPIWSAGFSLGFTTSFSFFHTQEFVAVIAKVDSTDLIAETDETNNTEFAPSGRPTVTVKPNPQPVLRRVYGPVEPQAGIYDSNSIVFSSGVIYAKIVAPEAGDRLKILKNGTGVDKMRVVGINLMLGSQKIGTVLGNKSTDIRIDLEAGVPLITVQRILRNIGFRGNVTTPFTRDITFQAEDGNTNLSNLATKTVRFA